MKTLTKNELGAWGESFVADTIKAAGWSILDRNWRTRGGELDIVAFDPQRQAIVAIEVKTRRSLSAGTAEESVTNAKLNRIRSLLLDWLLRHGAYAPNIAVDVVAVVVDANGNVSLNHVKNAQ